jgi:hypothetical protein
VVAGVVVLDIADRIRAELGGPPVTALARRFGPDGRCLTCGRRLGAEPLSVRAYRDADSVTLIAHHAGCASSAWLDVGPGTVLSWQQTRSAAVTSAPLPVANRLWRRWLPRPAAREQPVPVLLVRPCQEVTRARQTGAGEAVNADLEAYAALGFTDLGPLSPRHPIAAAARAWIRARGDDVSLSVTVGDSAWYVTAAPPVAGLIGTSGGVLVGVTCDRDPSSLVADTHDLGQALSVAEVLLAWAPLSAAQQEPGHPERPC